MSPSDIDSPVTGNLPTTRSKACCHVLKVLLHRVGGSLYVTGRLPLHQEQSLLPRPEGVCCTGWGVALGLCFRHRSCQTTDVKPLMSLLPDACVGAKSLQSCLTLCNLMSCSPAGSSAHGILRSRTLEWVAIPFSRGSSWPRDRTPISCVSCIASGFFTAEPPGKPSVAQSRLSSVLKLGKCRLCQPLRCSPTGGRKETSFQSPSGSDEK